MNHHRHNSQATDLGILDNLPVVRAENVPDVGTIRQSSQSVSPKPPPPEGAGQGTTDAKLQRDHVGVDDGHPMVDHAAAANNSASPFNDDREYRFCRAVANNPMRPSSEYPSLAGMSPKTAKPIRVRLIDLGLIREHKIETGKRGGQAIRLEPLPAADAAITTYEALEGDKPR